MSVAMLKGVMDFEEAAEEERDLGETSTYFKARGGKRKSEKRITDIDVVEEQDLRNAVSSLPINHGKEVTALLVKYGAEYPKWRFQLSCGFGLLMYGFGSKIELLEDFAKSSLTDAAVVVVNGYLPAINVKEVIFNLAHMMWEQQKKAKSKKIKGGGPESSQSIEELIALLKPDIGHFLYLIVHNIDGPGLRDANIQRHLGNLAACSQVRLLASTDHVNAPLLWDKQMATAQFNWWWHHTPTYASYHVETTHTPLLLASDGPRRSSRAAILVLRSLTPNAQSVFRTLADSLLAHPDEPGVTQNRLYNLCREKFLVSSEVTLRSILGEFRDHKLVKSRRGRDGQDCLYIPLPQDAIISLLQDMKSL